MGTPFYQAWKIQHGYKRYSHQSQSDVAASKGIQSFKEVLEDLVAEVRRHGVLKKLPLPCEANELLGRYMLLRKAGGMHFATAQNNMVWEPLYRLLVQPVENMAKHELTKLRL